ncbi:MAG: hypothetical protein NC117_01790 [Pseudoflavonifractor sp.]|nr:hypothetical protein [Pseudoflavonifractor sp.]
MNSDNKNRITAITGTVLFHAAILVALITAYMRYESVDERQWPPVDSADILFAGEYVMLGDVPAQTATEAEEASAEQSADEAASDSHDITDEGNAGDPAPIVSSTVESAAKVKEKPQPEKAGPSKEELARREREKQRQEEAKRINERVKFGGSGKSTGKSGSPDGNASTGTLSGAPGHNLKGRTVAHWGRPSSTLAGVVRIRVSVNKQGKVVGTPAYVGGSGPAAANMTVRQRCIQASRESQFSVALDGPATQTGVITWRFE